MGNSDAFLNMGNDGSAAVIWQAGNKIIDFSLRDVNGDIVKMIFLGIETLDDGSKYLNISAFSKAGGLTLYNLTEDEITKLKEAGLSGIMIKGIRYNWQ